MSEHEHTEVGTKLTLDDHASEALHHIKEGFAEVGEKVHELGHELVGMAKQAAAVAIGFQLNGMIESFHELGHELVESAMHLEEQKKGLAGLISMTSGGEDSMEELGEKAEKLNDRFESLGIQIGVTKESLLDAFEVIASRSTRGTEAAAVMTEKMAQAARVLPGGVGAIAGAFRDLESGVVRPKNAIVQLMRQTGVAAGTARNIAKSITGMLQTGQQDRVIALAESAIDRMSEKMKKVPPTFSEILTSIGTMRENIFETMGTPALRALVPQFDRLKAYMVQHRDEIEHWAQTMGEKVGHWVERAAEMIREGFQYLEANADDIFKALRDGARALKNAIAFMVEHKNLIMGLMLANKVGGVLGGRGGVVSKVASNAPEIGAAIGEALRKQWGQKTFGVQMGAAGTLAGAGAGVVAAVAWQAAFDQAAELEKESGLTTTNTLKHLLHIGGGLAEASNRILSFSATLRRFNESAEDINVTGEDLDTFAERIRKLGEAAVEAGDMTRAEYNKIVAATEEKLRVETQSRVLTEQMAMAADATAGGMGLALAGFTNAFKTASDANAKEAMDQARKILTANEALRTAIGGFGSTVENALEKLKGLVGGKTEGGLKLPPINFGPTTMNIKQDFRDVDPDRVAIVMRKDFAKHAVSRIQSRLATPFGF